MAKQVKPRVIEQMKEQLHARISEWLGFDIPEEGTEDYERWNEMVEQVDAITNLDDVVSYIEEQGFDPEEFLAEWDVKDERD